MRPARPRRRPTRRSPSAPPGPTWTPPRPALRRCGTGWRWPADLGAPVTALRAYINLSDVLELLGRHAEARGGAAGTALAEPGRDVSHPRLLPDRQHGRAAAPARPLGRGRRADRRGAGRQPEGVFSATLHACGRSSPRCAAATTRRGGNCAPRVVRRHQGRAVHAAAAVSPRHDRARPGRSAGGQGRRGRPGSGTQPGVARGTPGRSVAGGMRLEADDATRYRDRREDVSAAITARCAVLAGFAARRWRRGRLALGRVTGSWSRGRAGRAEGRGTATAADWAAAGVAAWRAGGEPYPLSYALLRLAEAPRGGRPRGREAAAAVNEAHDARARLGADAGRRRGRALARRARLSLARADGQASGNAGQPARLRPTSLPASGSPTASARSCSSSPPADPTRRSPRRCSSARRPPACTCPTSWPSSASAAGSRPPPSPTASALSAAKAAPPEDRTGPRTRAI